MQAAPPLENVYEAVSSLFNNPDNSEKEKASAWLGELQKSVVAWKIADELLHQKKDVESCYFAAQTMRTKVQMHFHELPVESHNSLRDSIMEHINQVTDQTNVVIITQLCLALADLALQMTSWQTPIDDLIAKYSHHNVWPLLEILTVLPEEVNSRTLRLGANRRNEVLQELTSHSKVILEVLKVCLSSGSENPQIHVKVLRCFTSWVSIQAITLPDITDNLVAPANVHEAATDCVCALLQHLEDNNNQQQLEVQLYTAVVSLEKSYHLSVAHESTEKSLNYCRIFTELAESMLEKIVSGCASGKPHFAIGILDLVLTCVGHHDYEVADITFNLWYRLSEELYLKNRDELTAVFKPYVERLIAALCRHCQIEPDHEGLLEDGEDFSDFRVKVSELIKDVVFIVGSSHCFRQMFLQLQEPTITWDGSEASLFIMQAVAKNILPEENDVVPKVMEAILHLPENVHIMVRHTSVLLLEPVLNFLLLCLQHAQLATVAAGALQSVCSACRDHMAVHLHGLLQIIRALDTFSISSEAAIGLLKGVSVIVGRMPPAQIHEAMKDICACQSDLKIEKGSKTDPVMWLDRLAAIFRHTSPLVESGAEHPCKAVVTEVFPVLSTVLTKYQNDLRTMERCCRCLRFAIRCVGRQAGHLLEPLVVAWKIADELLHQKKDVESCYFAAQTMRTKVQMHFHELPVESHNSLRDSIMEHINQVTDQTNVVIITQLCLALADLALQMTSWQTPIDDLIAKYSHHNVWPLLEILTVLPEEVNSRTLRLGANRRNEVLQELTSHSKVILEVLKVCLSSGSENPQIHVKVLRCFTSWVSIQAITLPDITDNLVAPANVHEAATDCVCALLQHLEDNNNQQQLEVQLYTAVVSLEKSYHLSVAHESTEKSLNYCRIFTELAESMLEKIVSGCASGKPHFAIGILDLVLTCVGHHDYEVADITFNLWYRLSEELYLKNRDELTAVFKPYVERLIAALCRHCQIEPDHEGLLEDGEDFSDFRVKVSELIKDVVFIVGSSHCFRQMFLQLQEPTITWDGSEASLFIMQAVAKNILPEENDVVPKVMEAILHLPENVHIMVRHTSVLLLEPVLNFLLLCLQHAQLATVAAGALQSVCSACRDHMAVHLHGLLQIIRALDTFSISSEAAIGLLKGVSVIVGRMPPAQIHEAMKDICACQ
ncbi:hypothetical protein B566_EDAN002287, partial [Ephemera danica]